MRKIEIPTKKSSKKSSKDYYFTIRVYPDSSRLMNSLIHFVKNIRYIGPGGDTPKVSADYVIDFVEGMLKGMLETIFVDHINTTMGYYGVWKPVSHQVTQFRKLVHLWKDSTPFSGSDSTYAGPSSMTSMKKGVRKDDQPFDTQQAKEEVMSGLLIRFVKTRTEMRKHINNILSTGIIIPTFIEELFDYRWAVTRVEYSKEFHTRFGMKVFIQDLAHSGFQNKKALSKKRGKDSYRKIKVSGYSGTPKHQGKPRKTGSGKFAPYFVFPSSGQNSHATMGGMGISFAARISSPGFSFTARPYLYLKSTDEDLIEVAIITFLEKVLH